MDSSGTLELHILLPTWRGWGLDPLWILSFVQIINWNGLSFIPRKSTGIHCMTRPSFVAGLWVVNGLRHIRVHFCELSTWRIGATHRAIFNLFIGCRCVRRAGIMQSRDSTTLANSECFGLLCLNSLSLLWREREEDTFTAASSRLSAEAIYNSVLFGFQWTHSRVT